MSNRLMLDLQCESKKSLSSEAFGDIFTHGKSL